MLVADDEGRSDGANSMHPLERAVPLRERVYAAIAEEIATGRLEPGAHLVESHLAQQLNVSRQPVREALQRLESLEWVDLRPGYGAFVHAPTDAEIEQTFEARTLLECETARLAATRRAENDLTELWSIWTEGVHAARSGHTDELVNLNSRLHGEIANLSGNDVLARLISDLDRRVRWYFRPIARARGETSWHEHADLIQMIETGDGHSAAKLMRQHTDHTVRAHQEQKLAKGSNPEAYTRAGKRRVLQGGTNVGES